MLAALRERLEERAGDRRRSSQARPARRRGPRRPRVIERVDGFRQLLQTHPQRATRTLVAQRQNDEMARLTEAGYEQNEQVKKISVVGGHPRSPRRWSAPVYGMNFDHMPELHWTLGYPFAVAC